MWMIREAKAIDKVFKKLPPAIQEKYQLWKALVRYDGPEVLRRFPGFHDEKLKGERKNQRSSRLSIKDRVIYKVEKDTVTVYVVELTAHKY